jgi:hypothetical protein
MAVKQELIIEILPDGNLKIKTEGFKGADCEDELKPLEEAMGEVTDRERTSDYYQQPTGQKNRNYGSTK